MANWIKLHRQRLVDKSIMMYKIVNNIVPDYLSLHFVLRESDFSLAIPQPRTNYCKRSLSYSGAVLWNSSPLVIRQSLSLDGSKSNLKNDDFDGIFHVQNFYFAFIHGFLAKLVFIICLIIVVVVNDLLVR